ncbi:MAG: hypothetical protein MR773_01625 [Eubacterium coprostanoligenes]|nr:hypothetical protein [Eubacterium coprostanoligenes]
MKFTKDTLNRAIRTFLQAALGYFSVNLVYISFSEDKATLKNTIIGFVIAGVSAGIAAVMNLESEDDENE